MATPAQESSAASGAPPHAKFSFAAAAKAVQASNKEANRVKFEKLKESREKAKAKLAAAREVIARLQQEVEASAGASGDAGGALALRELRRENEELRAALRTQAAAGGVHGEQVADLAALRAALWGTSALALAATLALAYVRATARA